MMGSSSIVSLSNIWKSWFLFRRGKKSTSELEQFNYYLEKNLFELYCELNNGKYKHGDYRKFIATDNKRREISVASIKDRVVHRLIYEYLIKIYDKIFIFDVWSCRKTKGVLGAIKRSQKFLRKYPYSFVWRADIKKFFDNVDQITLQEIIFERITNKEALVILAEIIRSYQIGNQEKWKRPKGIPIGNLTSQIFSNIYLNELDRFVNHIIKPKAYMRYGDDFIVVSDNLRELEQTRKETVKFIMEELFLSINVKNDIIVKVRQGIKFLGVKIFSKGRRINGRNWQRAKNLVNSKNVPSYSGLVRSHSKEKIIKEFNWTVLSKTELD